MRFARLIGSALLALAACTPGGTFAPAGGGGGNVTTIDVNLTLDQDGYSPDTLNVAVGSKIRFTNSDSFSHTATLIPGAASFPNSSPFTSAALTQSGNTITQTWSSGTLSAGASSQTILVDAAGTYLYGCFFHYGAPMRGTIVAQ